MIEREFVKLLIKRLARIDGEGGWNDGLNPAQLMALEYLGRANRFSRSPSQVAEFMGSTRGTVSQTLKVLAAKGYIAEEKSETDRRSITYKLMVKGRDVVAASDVLGQSLDGFSPAELGQLSDALRTTLSRAIKDNAQRPFGICRTCQHFSPKSEGGHCTLLDVALKMSETHQICFEQVPV